MTFRSAAAAMVVLAATTAWTQSAPLSTAGRPVAGGSRAVVANSNALGIAETQRAQSAEHKRVEDMENTLTRMHAVLKQMQAKTSASSTKDPLIKANLEMWGLMLQDLDKQYEQLKLASRAREDLEARRASMYKQAEARATLAARNPQGSGSVPAATADHGPATSPAGANAAAPATPPTQSAPAASSQN